MAGLFISYRRNDHAQILFDLYYRLVKKYGSARVFRDLDNLVGGLPFTDQLRDSLAESSVVLVIIGPAWATITDETGQRKLDDPEDFLRQEVEQALASSVRTVPVLIANAKMPKKEEIPASVHQLLLLHALKIRPDHFDKDVATLLKHIDLDMRKPSSFSLFNGKNLTGWYLSGPHTTRITTGDGVLTAHNASKQKGYVDHLVSTRNDFSDFHLQYEFFLEKAEAPVAIQIRVDPSQITFGGMRGYLISVCGSEYIVQQQYLEHQDHIFDASITTLTLSSRARPGFGLLEASHRTLTLNTWHQVEVQIKGNRLRVWVNRRLDVSGSKATRERPVLDFEDAGQTFYKGAIALVFYPGSSIRYRNIRIRHLGSKSIDTSQGSKTRWIHRKMIGNEWNEQWQVFQHIQGREWIESVTDLNGFWQHLFSEVDRTDEYIELQREYGPNQRVVVRLFSDHAAIGAARDQLTDLREGQWN